MAKTNNKTGTGATVPKRPDLGKNSSNGNFERQKPTTKAIPTFEFPKPPTPKPKK